MPKISIVLAGPSGIGKSTIGQELAAQLGVPFTDVDQTIEQETSLTIAALFERRGEVHFRRLESQRIIEASGAGGVVAAGAGGLVSDFTLNGLSGSARIVTLRASVETLTTRLESTTDRPPFNRPDWRDEVARIFQQRRSAYDRLPNPVETDDRSVAGLVDEIRARLPHLAGGGDQFVSDRLEHAQRNGHTVLSGRRSHPSVFEFLRSRLDVDEAVLVSDAEEGSHGATIFRADLMANGIACSRSAYDDVLNAQQPAAASPRPPLIVVMGDRLATRPPGEIERLLRRGPLAWLPSSRAAVDRLPALPRGHAMTIVLDAATRR